MLDFAGGNIIEPQVAVLIRHHDPAAIRCEIKTRWERIGVRGLTGQTFLSRQHFPELDVPCRLRILPSLEGERSSIWRQRDKASVCRQAEGPKFAAAGHVP